MPVRRTGVIYLQKDRFQFYLPQFASVLEFRFVPEMVRDGDVFNSELIENVVKLFVTNSKIPPSDLIIVLADNISFLKDITPPAPQPQPKTPGQPLQTVKTDMAKEELDEEVKRFITHVPFETVISKSIPIKNGVRVFATNQELFDVVKKAFEKLGFMIEGVFPGVFYGNNLSAKPVMDAPTANFFLSRVNLVRQYNLLEQKIFVPESKSAKEEEQEPVVFDEDPSAVSKKRMPLLLGVFGLLIVVLVVVIAMNFNQFQPHKPVPHPTPAAVAAVAGPVATTAPSIAPSIIAVSPDPTEAKKLTVQIINASDSPKSSQSLREALEDFGFKNVRVQAQTLGVSGAVVTFSSVPSPAIRNVVLDEVRKVTSEVKVQEKKDVTTDITIILGK